MQEEGKEEGMRREIIREHQATQSQPKHEHNSGSERPLRVGTTQGYSVEGEKIGGEVAES